MTTTTTTLAALVDEHGVDVLDHLDRQVAVPNLTGIQRQGDVLIVPTPNAAQATTPVGRAGTPVVRGENGGNTHAVVGDGVLCDTRQASATNLTLAVLTVPEGKVAYLAHPEHGYTGIGAGTYTLRRQREAADEIRLVQD